MISFNGLLRYEQVEPGHLKLIRHKDSRYPGRPTPYQLWRSGDGTFERYQQIQSKKTVYQKARMIASFVGTPLDETLFVGCYLIKSVSQAPAGMLDPVSGEDVAGLNFYDLELSPHLADYRGRLVIQWGKGYRAWFQWAAQKDKPVVEIRRTVGDPPFPGFLNFCERLSLLSAVPLSWRVALSSVTGVYLLTCPAKGTQYVGIAHGSGGFWGRWEDYVASGHGGNRRMRDIPVADYQVTVLEVASSSVSLDELSLMETRWKRKLLTREFGLNAN